MSVPFALAALPFVSSSSSSAAAVYPDRPVRIVVPFAPGGGTDAVARTLAQEMAGLVMVAAPPEELDRYFRGEEERWRKVIRDAGITAE
jgi:tripartite-type tricarboxylate transporter receptor subunit TctC